MNFMIASATAGCTIVSMRTRDEMTNRYLATSGRFSNPPGGQSAHGCIRSAGVVGLVPRSPPTPRRWEHD